VNISQYLAKISTEFSAMFFDSWCRYQQKRRDWLCNLSINKSRFF